MAAPPSLNSPALRPVRPPQRRLGPPDAFAAITKLTGLFGAALNAVIAISSLAQITGNSAIVETVS